jgi:hypothetical protein
VALTNKIAKNAKISETETDARPVKEWTDMEVMDMPRMEDGGITAQSTAQHSTAQHSSDTHNSTGY